MALIFSGSKCAICHETISAPIYATSGYIFNVPHKLGRYSDAAMHWDCFAKWEHQQEFANLYFEATVERAQSGSLYWYLIAQTKDVLVQYGAAIEDIIVSLRKSGTAIRVRREEWSQWIEDGWSSSYIHELEKLALEEVLPFLRSLKAVDQYHENIELIQQLKVADQKIYALCRLTRKYKDLAQQDKAYKILLLAEQYIQSINSKDVYRLLVEEIIAFRHFDQLTSLIVVGQRLGADQTLAEIALILASAAQEDHAIAVIQSLRSDLDVEKIKSVALAKVAVHVASQGNLKKAEYLFTQSLDVAQQVKHEKNKVLAEVAIQAAIAKFYDRSVEITQIISNPTRRTQVVDEIQRLKDISQ